MLGSYTAQESILALVVALLTTYELSGVVRARRAGRSRNLSRLFSHGLMLLLLGPWVAYTYYWVDVMEAPGVSSATFGSGLNLPYLLIGIALLVLAAGEILALHRAREAGHTRNVSRLVTHGLIALTVVLMVTLSLFKWNDYVTVEEYEDLLPTAAQN